MTVELECADGRVHAHVDGEEVVEVDLRRRLDEVRALDDFTQTFEIEAAGGGLHIAHVRVDRACSPSPPDMSSGSPTTSPLTSCSAMT